jgi:hypothetical protein
MLGFLLSLDRSSRCKHLLPRCMRQGEVGEMSATVGK